MINGLSTSVPTEGAEGVLFFVVAMVVVFKEKTALKVGPLCNRV
jgi:hypothetical protein